jgi:hypothetical protein
VWYYYYYQRQKKGKGSQGNGDAATPTGNTWTLNPGRMDGTTEAFCCLSIDTSPRNPSANYRTMSLTGRACPQSASHI